MKILKTWEPKDEGCEAITSRIMWRGKLLLVRTRGEINYVVNREDEDVRYFNGAPFNNMLCKFMADIFNDGYEKVYISSIGIKSDTLNNSHLLILRALLFIEGSEGSSIGDLENISLVYIENGNLCIV